MDYFLTKTHEIVLNSNLISVLPYDLASETFEPCAAAPHLDSAHLDAPYRSRASSRTPASSQSTSPAPLCMFSVSTAPSIDLADEQLFRSVSQASAPSRAQQPDCATRLSLAPSIEEDLSRFTWQQPSAFEDAFLGLARSNSPALASRTSYLRPASQTLAPPAIPFATRPTPPTVPPRPFAPSYAMYAAQSMHSPPAIPFASRPTLRSSEPPLIPLRARPIATQSLAPSPQRTAAFEAPHAVPFAQLVASLSPVRANAPSSRMPDWPSSRYRHPSPFSSPMQGIERPYPFLVTTYDLFPSALNRVHTNIQSKKKYKPVALKARPVRAPLPSQFRIVRHITVDPMDYLPALRVHHFPELVPAGRYTAERMAIIDKTFDASLWPEERKLFHHLMLAHEKSFAWEDSERGSFKEEYFPPIVIPVIPHVPWVEKNIPIPPGLFKQICEIVQKKIKIGVYEPSNASYRSRWFCVLKADKHSLRPVHSLEQLNRITIQHSGVPPIPDHIIETFAGRPCGGTFDIYVGYDNRALAEESRDLTTFQTPYGLMRLTTLPMGWTNSVPIFHDDVSYILRDEIPHCAVAYIDDCVVRGPESDYKHADGTYETIPQNPGIRRFVLEHAHNVNRVVTRMAVAGGTFSGPKTHLINEVFDAIGSRCTPQGRVVPPNKAALILNWGDCHNLSELRAFLGTVGVVRIFIKDFAKRASALVRLTRKDIPFEWGDEQRAAQADLKEAVSQSPALRPINHESEAPVIVAVDTSYIAVGFYLAQADPAKPRVRYFSRFGSITLNEREARFSQAKLEIYGLYRALRALKLFILGVRNLVVEVDARYIAGMLKNPDLSPAASINRWIIAILLFQFELVHVPGKVHGPDGLSRRPPQPGDPEPDDDEDEFEAWVDRAYGFLHILNDPVAAAAPHPLAFAAYAGDLGEGVPELEEDGDHPPTAAPVSASDYDAVPRSKRDKATDDMLSYLPEFHRTLTPPAHYTPSQRDAFIRLLTHFFALRDRVWRRDATGAHKMVPRPEERLAILKHCHDELGHKGVHATSAHVLSRFWWPGAPRDVVWYVRSCHLCQVRQMRQILIPPTVPIPAPLFWRVHIDIMFMPISARCKLFVHARCALCHYPEGRALRQENAEAIANWLFQDLFCRWGALGEIITDNGGPFVKALDILERKYHITHIRISGYNSRANGIIERPHLDMRQSLFKAADGDQSKWAAAVDSVLWSERITVRKRMGCSPYFAVTGTHPLIPLDVVEATYLIPPPDGLVSTTDLIAARAIALQKRDADLERLRSRVYAERVRIARRFEEQHRHVIRDFAFKRGDLVLMRNTAIEKSLNRKMRPRYLGPLVVVARNRGGAYILCELDGTVFDRPIAAFRVIPYLARASIPLPDNFQDITPRRLHEMEEEDDAGEDIDAPHTPLAPVSIPYDERDVSAEHPVSFWDTPDTLGFDPDVALDDYDVTYPDPYPDPDS